MNVEKEYWVGLLALITALIGLVAALVGRRKVHEVRIRREDATTDDDKEVLVPIVKDATGKDVPKDTIPTAAEQGQASGTRSSAQDREGTEEFRIWLLEKLRQQKRVDAAEVAERLFSWA